jgi:hypothetical protein
MFDNPFSENLTIYKVMSKSIVVTLISFPLQRWFCELTSVLHYTYFISLVLVFNLGLSVFHSVLYTSRCECVVTLDFHCCSRTSVCSAY